MKRTLFFGTVVAAFCLALVVGPGAAQGGDVSFGIRPTKADKDRPETFSYFSYTASTGSIISDEALAVNSGNVPITLKLYAADGITAQNGGTAFAQPGQLSNGVSRGTSEWISLPVSEVMLGPGEEQLIPFTVQVPANAAPGHHVAGLVVEAQPVEGEVEPHEGQAQFAVNVVRRVGVAVVVDVAGEHVTEIGIAGVDLQQQSEQGATFRIYVHNSGNVYTKGEGYVLIRAQSGEELASLPWTMETVLPGDTTFFNVTHPIHLADGDYRVSVLVTYAGKSAVLEDVEIKVRNGQPVVTVEPGSVLSPGGITYIVPPKGPGFFENLTGWGRGLVIAAIVLLVAGLAAAEVYIWRKVKRAPDDREQDQSPAS